jgi:lysophospholipase
MELFAIPGNPIPSNPFVGSVTTADGVTLRYARWRPTTRRTLGTVCIIQGRAEFIEKYFETITELRRRGFAVVAFDLRGQGGSERLLPDPRKGHVDDFAEYGEDISTILQSVIIPSMPKPYFALAHSMGAAALLLALDRGETRFERVVLLAPLIGLAAMKYPFMARSAAAMMDFLALGTSYVPTGGATSLATRPFAGNRLTSDPMRYQRVADIVAARPRLALGDPTVRWTFAMFAMFSRFAERDFGRRLAVPSLMLIPGSDPLCSSNAAEQLAARIRACQPVIIPGAKHELLTERDAFRAQFFAAFDRFIPGETQEQDLLPVDEEKQDADQPARAYSAA